jgi:hypothetical protein
MANRSISMRMAREILRLYFGLKKASLEIARKYFKNVESYSLEKILIIF